MSTTEPKEYLIRAGIRRNYGLHEVYYEISEQVTVSNGQERRDAFQNLQAQLEDQIKVYEAVSLPHVRLPQTAGHPQTGNANSDTFPLESIRVEFSQGKRIVRAIGGKWKKFGIPVYDDCDTMIGHEALDFGEHPMSELNLTVHVELEDGKPKRARSIK